MHRAHTYHAAGIFQPQALGDRQGIIIPIPHVNIFLIQLLSHRTGSTAPVGAIARMERKRPGMDIAQAAHPASSWLNHLIFSDLSYSLLVKRNWGGPKGLPKFIITYMVKAFTKCRMAGLFLGTLLDLMPIPIVQIRYFTTIEKYIR